MKNNFISQIWSIIVLQVTYLRSLLPKLELIDKAHKYELVTLKALELSNHPDAKRTHKELSACVMPFDKIKRKVRGFIKWVVQNRKTRAYTQVIDEVSHLSKPGIQIEDLLQKFTFNTSSGSPRIISQYNVDKSKSASDNYQCNPVTTWEHSRAHSTSDAKLLGDTVRWHDVPAVQNPKYGIFLDLPEGYDSSEQLARVLNDCIKNNFGKAGERYSKYLCKNYATLTTTVQKFEQKFREEIGFDDLSDWEKRQAAPYGLFYAALAMGNKARVIKLSPKIALSHIVSVYASVIQHLNDVDQGFHETFRRVLQEYAKPINEASITIYHRESVKGVAYVAAEDEELSKLLPKHISPKRIAQELDKNKLILKNLKKENGNEKLREQVMTENGKPRMYRIKLKSLKKFLEQ